MSEYEHITDSFLQKLGSLLSHRGPDGQKNWISDDRCCGFVHARLAIIDVSTRSNQPMLSDDGRYSIVFNGEIFNFLELRDELSQRGIVFRTESDTEVLLQSYIMWGSDMLPRLNGMWALAIRDNVDGSIFLARDRFGIKPLLYSVKDRRIAFASEVRVLLAIPWVDRTPSSRVMQRQLFDPFGVEASEYTLHDGIRRLPAGHFARCVGGRMDIQRWWKTSDHLHTDVPSTLTEAAGQFRERFVDAVRLRMRSDVAIGSCLSGGFDSAAIVSAMRLIAEQSGAHQRGPKDWRHAFIATFDGHPHDESFEASLSVDYTGVTPHIIACGADDGVDFVEEVLDSLDDVYLGLPTAPWRIYRAARNAGIRVTLDGHGADEMMGAYFSGSQRVAFNLRNILSQSKFRRHIDVQDLARLALLRKESSYFLREMPWRPPARMPIAAYSDELPKRFTGLDHRLYNMFHSSVLPTILRNFDRLSMAHGVEARMPFMDWRLVTYTLGLPSHLKANSQFTKLVAREAMAGLMPEAIRTSSRKSGFNSQMPAWMNGSLGDWSRRLLSTPHDAFDEIVDRPALLARVKYLTGAKKWTWASAGRIWPYINLKWYLDRRCS